MNIAHRLSIRPVVTRAAQRGVRIRAATSSADVDIAISERQAEQLRRDLAAVLARMRREDTPLPAPSGSGSRSD